MPRPRKCRRVCALPKTNEFIPVGTGGEGTVVVMTVDEFETIRWIDVEGLSQEECSVSMNVARTTVQQIYNSARKKLGLALVEGLPLRIQGGEYRLCDGKGHCMRRGGCHRRHSPWGPGCE